MAAWRAHPEVTALRSRAARSRIGRSPIGRLVADLAHRHDHLPERYDADRRRHLEGLARRPDPPLVVYAMGKSGTSAIADSLIAAGHGPVLKIHSLQRDRLARVEAQYRSTDPTARPWHVWDAHHLLERPPTPSRPWTVITSVRDPVAQMSARFFQAGERLGLIHPWSTAAELRDEFLARWRTPPDWFDIQFGRYLGVDIYRHPFDPTTGWATVETPALRILLVRTESLAVAPVALGTFLGSPEPVPLLRSNVGADKSYATLYHEFVAGLRLPDDLLAPIYATKLVRHFYTPDEIDGFRRRWTR